MEEVEAGFLVVSPRFAIRQSNKTRPIDNLTSSGVNGTVGLANRLQVEGADLEPKVFLGGTLPFGASASVAAFLRASKALRELGTRMFSLVWAAYFDDFVCICKPGEEDSTGVAVRFLFKNSWLVDVGISRKGETFLRCLHCAWGSSSTSGAPEAVNFSWETLRVDGRRSVKLFTELLMMMP